MWHTNHNNWVSEVGWKWSIAGTVCSHDNLRVGCDLVDPQTRWFGETLEFLHVFIKRNWIGSVNIYVGTMNTTHFIQSYY